MSGFPKAELEQLKQFVEACKAQPDLLHKQDLAFFKNWLEGMGATLPSPATKKQDAPKGPEKTPAAPSSEPEEESEESDIELDNSGVVEDAGDEVPEYPDMDMELTDEMLDQADILRSQATSAMSEGNLDEALKLFNEAIQRNPGAAMLYAKRASVYIRMQKLKAAIHDCDKAISLNPDTAQPYKFRGKAKKLLGEWEDAYKDLTVAEKLDYDEDIHEMLKQVKPNALKIIEHKRKCERKREERQLKARKEKFSKAKEAQEKARAEAQSSGGMPGGFHGAGAGAGSGLGGMPDIASLLQDPEIMAAFQDPEVSQAFMEISQNPANISKYQGNPKIQKIIQKMSQKFGGGSDPGSNDGSPQPPPSGPATDFGVD